MKIYYDSCQSMVALRKQHKLLMQHLTSRGSRLALLKLRRPLASSSARGGRILDPTSPSALWPPSALEWCGVWTLGGQSLLDVLQDPRHQTGPSQGYAAVFQHLLPLQTELSVPLDPVSCTRTTCSFLVAHRLPCSSCFSSFFSSLAAKHRARIRLCKGW